MNELSCKTVSDLAAADACRGPIIAPTVPRVASCRNARRDVVFDGTGPVILFSLYCRVVEPARHHSYVAVCHPTADQQTCVRTSGVCLFPLPSIPAQS